MKEKDTGKGTTLHHSNEVYPLESHELSEDYHFLPSMFENSALNNPPPLKKKTPLYIKKYCKY